MKQAIIYTAKYPYLPKPHLQQIRYQSGPALSAITLIVSDGFRLISVAADGPACCRFSAYITHAKCGFHQGL